MKMNKVLLLLIGLLVLPAFAFGLNIQSVDFMNVDNKSRLQIGLDETAVYDISREGDKVILRISNARIPDGLARPFVTKEFVTAINQILPQQAGADVIFEISMKQMSPYFVIQDKDLLLMDFDIPLDSMKEAQAAKQPAVEKIVVDQSQNKKVVKAQPNADTSLSGRAQDLQATMVESSTTEKYSGKRISLDFQNADIHNVLRIIADVSALNIVTSDDVKGNITIRLKNVPWDQALDVILESKDLGKMAIGNVVRIAPADKIKAAQDRQLATIKTKEQLEPLVTSVIPVNFAKASDIGSTIKGKDVGMVSERGSITAEDRTNVLIVKDIKKNVDAIYAMIKRLDKATPQVLIQARIVQADKTFTRGLGVQWGGSYRNQSNSSYFGLTGANSGSTTNLFDTSVTSGTEPNFTSSVVQTPSFAVNFPAGQAAGLGINLGRLAGSMLDLDLRLDIGESTGTAKVVARPKIITLDNKKATIRQGEKYPYVVQDDEGQFSTEFKDLELVLEVTPRIAFDGSVNMEISVKRNALGSLTNRFNDPSIATREAITEVLVKDGETSVIGGIIEEESIDNVSQVPGLGNLPVVGYLFKGTTKVRTNKELLIFISPHVIEPASML
ncbi:MAG: type IV pilus secretin PilQ [Deltaproteobacteria bacterium]|nr:type IV pilus secretin PilQ [Deltaproteobacteria bacterium]